MTASEFWDGCTLNEKIALMLRADVNEYVLAPFVLLSNELKATIYESPEFRNSPPSPRRNVLETLDHQG